MKNAKRWFTLVEIIIVLTIITLMATIAIYHYVWNLVNGRNALRVSDMSNINMALNSHKQQFLEYPIPWGVEKNIPPYIVKNGSVNIFHQWYLNNEVSIVNFTSLPKDPLTKTNYLYSVSHNKLFFQIGMGLEITDAEADSEKDNNIFQAYVKWNYQQIHESIPSLLLANISNNFDIKINSGAFIVDGNITNIPYDSKWLFINGSTNINNIIFSDWVSIPQFRWYSNCKQIENAWSLMWSWVYYGTPSSIDC